MFLAKNNSKIKAPKRRTFKLDFKTKKPYRKTKNGNQIIVGFIPKTNADTINKKDIFWLPERISLKIINEKTITAKSGLGDCENKNKNGKNTRCKKDFFSKM